VVGCFIGPNDLALSMGLTQKDMGPGTQHEAAMMEVLAAAKKTGKAAGKHCYNAAEVSLRIRQGFQFLALMSDGALMAKAAQQEYGAIDFSGAAEAGAQATGQLY
jgi:4-hydroxy-2-oxoheptanedioate aldolase